MAMAWDTFISHASEDKDEVALPLAAALSRAGLTVWLDRQQLVVGDSLRDKINEGLANSRFGIIIISPAFLNKRFPRNELNSLSAIEDSAGRPVILPVWHNVNVATLAAQAPLLADRLAADTGQGIPTVAESIIRSIVSRSEDSDSAAITPLRLLNRLLDGRPDHSAIVDLLAAHSALIPRGLGYESHWLVRLGDVVIDLCSARQQYTTNEITWSLTQFGRPEAPLFINSSPAPELQASIRELKEVRGWIPSNLRSARNVLPGITAAFRGFVVAGRRELLDADQQRALRLYHDVNPWIKIHTYDWIIDSATENHGLHR